MIEKIKIEIETLDPLLEVSILYKNYQDIFTEIYEKMLQDILNTNITMHSFDIDCKFTAKFEKRKKSHYRYASTLILESDISNLSKNIEKYYLTKKHINHLSDTYLLELKKSDITTEIKKFIMDFTFALNLAYPGFFEFNIANIFYNDIEISTIDITVVPWCSLYKNFLENKWPKISILSYAQVWNWLLLKTNYMEGFSQIAIDRALNALTYTLGNINISYEQLFYVLIGIEALYNDNCNNGIAEQIREKTEALLQRPPHLKKQISMFYNNRSEFLHGKLNFPNSYYPYDATDDYNIFFKKMYSDTIETALAILLSTVQEFIIHDANELKTKILTNLE